MGGGGADSHDFGVSGRIACADRLVVPGTDDFVGDNDNRPDRHLVTSSRLQRLLERRPHEPVVGIHDSRLPRKSNRIFYHAATPL